MTNTAYLHSLGITRWVQRDKHITTFGVDNQDANLMIIGEVPGFHEDQQDEPFVERTEQLLTAMIKSMGFTRNDIHVATCTQSLEQQIALIKPTLILAVGHIATHYLLKTKMSLESLRNQIHHYGETNTPLIATYHPAYLLRSPQDKKKAYQDLQFALATLHSS